MEAEASTVRAVGGMVAASVGGAREVGVMAEEVRLVVVRGGTVAASL